MRKRARRKNMKSETLEVAKRLIEALRSMGLKASGVEELEGSCAQSYIECCGSVIRLVFFDPKYGAAAVVKITQSVFGCEDVIYDPHGLYVLIGGPDEAGKVKDKLGLAAKLFHRVK